jgi:hypothetical protein
MSDRQTGHLPFREAVFQPPDLIAALTQYRDRLERQNAPRTTAIRDNLPVHW